MSRSSATFSHTSSIHSWYTLDDFELRNILEAPDEETDEEQLKGTPTRPPDASHLRTLQSVNLSFHEELQRSRYRGISFEEFLKCSFGVSDEDMEALKQRVDEMAVHKSEGYMHEAKLFAKYAEKLETKMYKPFAEMGNMVLDAHQGESGNRIKVHPSTGNEYVKGDGFAKRKPDVSLIPETDGGREISSKSLRWYHMLCVLEFKIAQSKRKRDPEEDDADPESKKLNSTNLTMEPITAITTPAVATASGSGSPSTGPAVGTRTSTGAKASSAGSPSNSVAATRTSSGTEAFGAAIPAHVREAADTFSACASPQPSSGAPQEDLSTLRNSQRLVGFSLLQNNLSGSPAPAAQVSPSTELNHLPINVSAVLNESTDDIGQAGEIPTDQVPQDDQQTAEPLVSAAYVDRTEVQLANYATEMLSAFSDRTFAFGAIVRETKMQLTYYSRSLYVISDEIDIVKEPAMFAVFLCLFAMQPLDKLGFSADLGYRNPFNSESEQTKKVGFELERIDGGDNFILKSGMKIELGERIYTEYCLMGRATTVFDVKRPEGCKVDLVAKVQSQPKSRRREDRAIMIAREVDPEHSPEIYGVAILPEKSPSEEFKAACGFHPKRAAEERELRVLLMRKYSSVEELSDEEFCEVVPQFAAYVHALFSQRELLHRDISIANMAYYMKDGRIVAALIDFDLATFPDETLKLKGAERQTASGSVNDLTPPAPVLDTPMVSDVPDAVSTPTSLYKDATASEKGNNVKQDRSGTTPFMAIETLDVELSPYVHHLCHELESLLYASVWHGVGYRWKAGIIPRLPNQMTRKKVEILRGWRVGSWEDVVEKKVAFLANPMHILKHIKSKRLRVACVHLTVMFDKRVRIIRQRAMFKDDPTVFVGEYGPRMTMIDQSQVGKALYPYFADIWGMGIIDCPKSCCV